MLLVSPLYSVIYLLSSSCFEMVVLLHFFARCLILSSPRIFQDFLVVNWGGTVFPYQSLKLWLPRPGKFFRPDALLLAVLSPVAWFCWACTALPVRKWGDVQDCSRSPDVLLPFPHAWNSRDTEHHLQMLVRPGGLMPQQLSLCGLNVEPWPVLWGVFLSTGTVFFLHHVCLLPHTTVFFFFFVCAFCWLVYWEARGELQLNAKGKAGSAETANKPEKQGESGE